MHILAAAALNAHLPTALQPIRPVAGGCGDSGRLDKEESRALREYQQPVVLFRDDALAERVLGEVRRLVGAEGSAEGGEGGGAA
jgi:hypothetical protein